MSSELRDIIALAFGEKQIQPASLPQVPQLARLISQVTPANVGLRAVEGAPTLGEEVKHLLATLEDYLALCAPGEIEKQAWAPAIVEGRVYEAFEELRRQADRAVGSMQPERTLNLKWSVRPLKVIDLLWHVADHTIHHRGRLALLLRLCGTDPAQA